MARVCFGALVHVTQGLLDGSQASSCLRARARRLAYDCREGELDAAVDPMSPDRSMLTGDVVSVVELAPVADAGRSGGDEREAVDIRDVAVGFMLEPCRRWCRNYSD